MPSVQGWIFGCALLCALGCSKPDLEAERAAILGTDQPWQDAIAAKDVERTLSFWADDAVVLAPGRPSLVGKDALRGFVTEAFKIPGFGLRWETGTVTVAPHGEMAYAVARTTTTLNGPDGKPIALRGKGATVWRKGADGRWKCVVDVWNDEPPPTP